MHLQRLRLRPDGNVVDLRSGPEQAAYQFFTEVLRVKPILSAADWHQIQLNQASEPDRLEGSQFSVARDPRPSLQLVRGESLLRMSK